MTNLQRRSRVACPKTDSSELFRSFEYGWIKGNVPTSIVYSKELAEFLEQGIDLTTLEVDGLQHVSKWHLSSAIVGADGAVTEFLLVQDAEVEVQLAEEMPMTVIPGSYYVRFERSGSGWFVRRRCVYQWQFTDDEEMLELNYVKMYRKLEVKPSSRYFENRIYELFDD